MKSTKMIALLWLLQGYAGSAQQYTRPVYAVRKDSAVVFGNEMPLNYCGSPFTLKMNIYKPVGDGNTQRPVVICVHGGAFTSDFNFNEPEMNVMAREFARRGYVAVSIDYREGHHLYPYATGNPQFKDLIARAAFQALTGSPNWDVPARLYVTDPAEVTRSIYRAQQDVKAAIRKMKARYLTDSSSACRVFLAGYSAGGIAVLAAALTDRDVEKPAAAGAITAAPNPKWSDRCETPAPWPFTGCWVPQIDGPAGRDNRAYIAHNPNGFNYDAPSCYQRPDLGPVNGSVNLSAGNTKVMGVASLCGALADTSILNGNTYPPIFMYHQPADRVVNYSAGKPFSYLNDFFTPGPNANWPVLYGSGWIKNKLKRMAYPAAYTLWAYDNSASDWLGFNAHNLLPSIPLITDSIARFFSRVMDTAICTGGNLRITPVETQPADVKEAVGSLQLFPNPVSGYLNVTLPEGMEQQKVEIVFYDATGKPVLKNMYSGSKVVQVDCSTLPDGIYFINLTGEQGKIFTGKIVKSPGY